MAKQETASNANKLNKALPHYVKKRIRESFFIVVVACALFVLCSLVTFSPKVAAWPHFSHHKINNAGGQVGAYTAAALFYLFGYCSYILPIVLAYSSWLVLKIQREAVSVNKGALTVKAFGFLFFTVGCCSLLNLSFTNSKLLNGGILGNFFAKNLDYAFSITGACLVIIALILIGLTWLTGLSWVRTTEIVGKFTLLYTRELFHLTKNQLSKGWFLVNDWLNSKKQKPPLSTKVPKVVKEKIEKRLPASRCDTESQPSIQPQSASLVREKRPAKLMVSGSLPSLLLLDKEAVKNTSNYSSSDLENVSREVEQHLLDFGIQADVVAVHPGPVITRFELQLAAGIKVSRLTTLAKDLARSLSVNSVRIVEVIPGKTVVGLELPNERREMVRLSEVLSADVYQQAHSSLTIALGVDIAGHPMVVDLAKMPHLLVAGTTGSGKSVGINAMILSLLFKATPEHVRLIMIDPKMLELSVYDGIPHLLTPVVTDMKEAASALRWCVAEMERRYRLMAALGVRNLAGFNSKIIEANALGEPLTDPLWKPNSSVEPTAPNLETLPYIVVIIDELADMMMVVGKKVEQLIARIAQKARAAGIHLILATQRPSVDVLTGLIKSNIPTRMSFQVSSKIDSRTILDQQGAEQLLGHGDMLYLAPGSGAPLRVHGAFVDDLEVHRVADDWRARGEPNYISEITQVSDSDSSFADEGQDTEDADPLYDQAVDFVLQTRKASISSVQRRLKVGYNRAARLVEEMERTGIVGPLDGGYRDVLVASTSEE